MYYSTSAMASGSVDGSTSSIWKSSILSTGRRSVVRGFMLDLENLVI